MSPHAPDPSTRAARAVVFATVCVALAASGHAAAGGDAPPLRALTTGFGGALLLALALAGRERSLPTIAGVLVGGQYALHCVFSGAAAGGMLGHHPAPVAAPVPMDHDTRPSMTLAHLAAALVSAWWLRRGERAVWGLARRAAGAARPARLLGVLAAVLEAISARLAPPPSPWAVLDVLPPRAVSELRHDVVRRGPPAVSVALG
ncbi:hypothetical protein [Actinomadura atramentaria]|uniref:hypothetical protein n=1 Tax=Actinomadura atramentaria TaxID=1990 RepID=UPI0005279693|nr:hypothetical protein [Actinomadura atramentaria]